ncbi:TPA: hypothetical protein PXE99_002095, partial [Mannheimia haemolytica]|nr:hypothetical protein [Mannheimia haemolytica]
MLTTSLKNSIKSFFSSSWGNLILSAFTGALVSLATTTYLDNKNREITLRPYVNVDFSANRENPESPQLGIVIDNLGKGPAIIENSTFYINNKRYPIKNEDFSKIMSEIISELNL